MLTEDISPHPEGKWKKKKKGTGWSSGKFQDSWSWFWLGGLGCPSDKGCRRSLLTSITHSWGSSLVSESSPSMTSLSWPTEISRPHRELCSYPARKNKVLVSEGRKPVWLSGTTNSQLAECSRSQRLVVWGSLGPPRSHVGPQSLHLVVPVVGSIKWWGEVPLLDAGHGSETWGEVSFVNTSVESSFRSVWRLWGIGSLGLPHNMQGSGLIPVFVPQAVLQGRSWCSILQMRKLSLIAQKWHTQVQVAEDGIWNQVRRILSPGDFLAVVWLLLPERCPPRWLPIGNLPLMFGDGRGGPGERWRSCDWRPVG